MIVRADDGGLGAMTWEAWRHLKPERTLVVLTSHETRGRADVSRFTADWTDTYTCRRLPSSIDGARFLRGLDVVYTAETWYGRMAHDARRLGIRTVLHAMPEMHHPALETADTLLVPTTWRRDLVPGSQVLPVPVARDRFTARRRTGCETMYHVASNAMCDRNGTALLLAALPLMRRSCKLIIRNNVGRTDREMIGRVEVEWRDHHHGPYWEAWPAEADVLVMPRRFGGLCLPMQEAAAQGVPIISLDLDPQNQWLPTAAMIPVVDAKPTRMRGGEVDVFSSQPSLLAAKLDELVARPELVAGLSDGVLRWADDISWERPLPSYEALLRT